MNTEQQIRIMQDALVYYIRYVDKTKHLVLQQYTIDEIREVYQNLPEVDNEYLEAKRIIKDAAKLIRKVNKKFMKPECTGT